LRVVPRRPRAASYAQGRHRLRVLGSQDDLWRHRRQVLGLPWRPTRGRRSAGGQARRRRRSSRPASRPAQRPPGAGAPADGSDKPAEAGAAPEAPKPAVKRVRKAPTPAAGGAKGE
jgi:small subunit ribosomal protein S3